MSQYTAQVLWQRGDDEPFGDNRYSRRHRLRFDGGAEILGSASPGIVAPPMSDPAGVDPEEMFVASLASCHMLWFLSLAAQRGFVVESYRDDAVGEMARNAQAQLVMSVVTLRPRVAWAGPLRPAADELHALHHLAHERCFIANSVKTEVVCEPQI